MVDEVSVIAKINRAVGKPVAFKYPGDEGQKKGVLKDRAIIRSNPGTVGVPYWDVVDLIEFAGDAEPDWIRIGYYRKPSEHLVWGSQTTITEPVSVWARILLEAARQKPWFKTLLLQVVAQLQE